MSDKVEICQRCAQLDVSFSSLYNECSNLTPYGVVVRYPNEIEILESDTQTAVAQAQKVFDFCTAKINPLPEASPPEDPK